MRGKVLLEETHHGVEVALHLFGLVGTCALYVARAEAERIAHHLAHARHLCGFFVGQLVIDTLAEKHVGAETFARVDGVVEVDPTRVQGVSREPVVEGVLKNEAGRALYGGAW